MNGTNFSLCVHILTLLSHFPDKYITSEFIADSINIHPVLVRNEIGKLKKAGLVGSKEGKSGGSRLGRPADDISLKDIFLAVKEPDAHTLNMYRNEPNPQCPVGAQIEEQLTGLYHEIDQGIMQKLENISLEKFRGQFA